MVFVPESLDSFKYAELQQLAKQCGVKANMKVSHVRLIHVANHHNAGAAPDIMRD